MSDILPVKIDIKADLTQSVDKIVDTVVAPVTGIHKGITKIISACSGKWFANQDRQVALIAAQTAKDVEDIKSGKKEYRNGELLNVELAPTMADYYRQISEHNGACDAKRLEAVMFTAALELFNTPEEEVADEPLNQTFFNHWRAEAELIDDEDLRQWWAHLLVEETKKPNSISPRTLDIAKNLSPYEAKLFEKLSLGICENFIITDQNDVPVSGAFSDILTLQDAGLINAQSSMITQERKSEESSRKYFVFAKAGYVVQIFSQRAAVVSGHSLTKAGRELYNITQVKQASLSSMIEIATIISQNSINSIASIHEITSASTDGDVKTLTFSDDPVWSSESVQESGGNK